MSANLSMRMAEWCAGNARGASSSAQHEEAYQIMKAQQALNAELLEALEALCHLVASINSDPNKPATYNFGPQLEDANIVLAKTRN